MGFSYNPANINPENTVPDLISPIRWLLQDIDGTIQDGQPVWEVQDEEINSLVALQDATLNQLTKVYRTASHLATALWRRYSKQATFSSGGTSVQLGQRAEAWKAVADQMLALATAAEMAEDNLFGEVLQPARDSQFPLWREDLWPTDPGLSL